MHPIQNDLISSIDNAYLSTVSGQMGSKTKGYSEQEVLFECVSSVLTRRGLKGLCLTIIYVSNEHETAVVVVGSSYRWQVPLVE